MVVVVVVIGDDDEDEEEIWREKLSRLKNGVVVVVVGSGK